MAQSSLKVSSTNLDVEAELNSTSKPNDQNLNSNVEILPEKLGSENLNDSYDSFDDQFDRPVERWAPLGAVAAPSSTNDKNDRMTEAEYLAMLEEDQEQLNSSLLALTTHFAQVQFRLKQIVSAPDEQREVLLKELEEFAFKGIPDVRGCKTQDAQILEEMSMKEHDYKISEQRQKQQELIHQLKSQLDDLELYNYEMGDKDSVPTGKMLEKQKYIIDHLRNKLNMDLNDYHEMSTEELKRVVDSAVGQIVNPGKVKTKLVNQLQTQIVDLERFIKFLQGEAESPGPLGQRCTCPVHGPNFSSDNLNEASQKEQNKKVKETTLSIMKQALTVLQIFAISQLGCGGGEFKKNLLKRTSKGNHWGDLRAKLEISIDKVHELQLENERRPSTPIDYYSDTEDTPVILCNQELTTKVRKGLAMSLKDLLQHGLMEVGQSNSLVQFGCFPSRSKSANSPKMMHVWDLFVKYYEMKHGKEYNESPARKLSQSFSLEIIGGQAITTKQTLLTAINSVLSSHTPLKRTEDSMFKAFVCLALNEKKLVPWLKLLLKTHTLIEFYYQPWSYVIKSGFNDALQSLDKLSRHTFHLPVDLAVRPFRNIKDAF